MYDDSSVISFFEQQYIFRIVCLKFIVGYDVLKYLIKLNSLKNEFVFMDIVLILLEDKNEGNNCLGIGLEVFNCFIICFILLEIDIFFKEDSLQSLDKLIDK